MSPGQQARAYMRETTYARDVLDASIWCARLSRLKHHRYHLVLRIGNHKEICTFVRHNARHFPGLSLGIGQLR